jgi:pimeloyl-ACP methyl ester carboxylesterase
VLRALTSTLLIAGVFYAPLSTPYSYADENATTTPEGISEVAAPPEAVVPADEPLASSSPEALLPAETVATTTPEEPVVRLSSDEPAPQPTGVLFDNSLADEVWDIGVYYPPGNYAYFPGGYTALSNPPTIATEGFWTTTGTTTVARVKRAGADTTCSNLSWGGTGGLSVFLPDFSTSFDTNPYWTRTVGEYCDFVFYGEGIPPGTALGAVFLGANYMSVAGSSNNPGTSLTGTYENPLPGGFAFQLCGVDGCSGGFATTTATTTPDVATTTPQVSNILFLPGIKGSRLYSNESRCLGGGLLCNNRLWDPRSSDDIRDLYLNEDGKSLRSDVYVQEGDIIDEVVGTKIYSSFIEDMNELQASSTYNGGNFNWKAAAYDWRLSLEDVINNGVEREGKIYYQEASSTPYIEQTLRQLAADSTTGKVTIVAHSNGGLVTKALLQKLGDVETAELVDKIIFVGVPQTGAPQALGGLLFGDRENLPFIANAATARGLAENSPMAYHLMPSANYLASVQDPNRSVIGFSGTKLYEKELGAYGPSIDTLEELRGFLLANEGGRTKPDADNATSANILNAGLVEYANDLHIAIDSWVPPATVELYQIAGWGVADTISGIDMYDEQKLFDGTIGYKRQYRPVFIEDGDGVVPIPSALMVSTTSPNVHRYWVNLREASAGIQDYDHGNMLELDDLRTFLRSTLEATRAGTEILLSTQPEPASFEKRLTFQLHSPLTLGVYDSDGNYTGLNEDGSVSEEVPGTTYGEFGEVKYLIAPAGNDYELILSGQGDGVFSLDIQEQQGDFSTTTTFADVPTTASTTVRLTITNGIADASLLSIDTDGDSEVDIEIAPVPGETVQYASPATAPEEIKQQSSSSGSIKRSTQTTTPVTLPFSAISASAIVATVPNTPNPRVLGADTAKTEASQTESSVSNQAASLNQTASVYNALSPFTEWFKTLLYNIWKDFLNLLSFL